MFPEDELLVSRTPDLKMTTEINQLINGKGIHIPPTVNKYEFITDKLINKPVYYKRNQFIIATMSSMGGGALKNCKKAFEYMRVGGSTQDLINYVCCYQDNSNREYEFQVPINIIHNKYSSLGEKRCCILTAKKTLEKITVNFNASAGIYRRYGFEKKLDALPFVIATFSIVFTAWCSDSKSIVKPKEVWVTAGRPKLSLISKALINARNSKPNCRAICIPSPIEQFLGYPLYGPVSAMFEKFFKENGYGIAIGVDRASIEWKKISDNFHGAKYVYGGDYSKYDTSIPANLMVRALDVIIDMFYNGKGKEERGNPYLVNYIENYREWFIENIINKEIIVHDMVKFSVKNGMPSGVLWTSLINSIVNLIVLEEAMSYVGIKNFKPVVYGDDHIIIIYEDVEQDTIKDRIANFIESKFGIKCNPDDSLLATPDTFFVGYERPIYSTDHDFSKGTRGLKPLYTVQSDVPFEEFDESKGETHRWKYNFSRRIKFLQYYWLPSGMSIRPSIETTIRLVNPEEEIKWISDYRITLVAYLCDNFNNAHVRSAFYNYFYDLNFLSMNFDYNKNKLLSVCNFLNVPEYFEENYKNKRVTPGERLWYRYQNGEHVEPYDHPCMATFNRNYLRLKNEIVDIITCVKDIEFYKRKDVIITMYKKQLCNDHRDLKNKRMDYKSNPRIFKEIISGMTEEDKIKSIHIDALTNKIYLSYRDMYGDFFIPIHFLSLISMDWNYQYFSNLKMLLPLNNVYTHFVSREKIKDALFRNIAMNKKVLEHVSLNIYHEYDYYDPYSFRCIRRRIISSVFKFGATLLDGIPAILLLIIALRFVKLLSSVVWVCKNYEMTVRFICMVIAFLLMPILCD